ncbi:MAG: aminotransferase class III-fold pyridoxal phosphate-dependent enzyme [candidate division NC10 bacterium]|nr:aminotransferase class III-fold pyridoxal phosphate-dependent enzyme [candidate division NC10 bacterium]
MRGSSVFFPAVREQLPVIVRAEGIYLYQADGQRLIDAAGGVGAVTSIGHGVEEVIQAIAKQARKVAFIPFFQYMSEPALELCDLVATLTPGTLKKVMLLSGGSEATENAVRLARQYHLERGNPSKFKVISRWQGFHGMTLGATGFGGHTGRRRKFMPMVHDHPHIPPASRYRCQFCQKELECNLTCARMLEQTIKWEGPENVAAFIAEPVVGAAMGAVPAPEGYFQVVREICDIYDVVFIADEVMSGFGRTGEMFAINHWGVVPDILVAAKGVSGGYAPLAVLIAKEEIITPLERSNANFVAGHTYSMNPLAAAAGLAVLRYLLDHDLVSNAKAMGDYLLAGLSKLREMHAIVGDVRGKGLLTGIELVKEKGSKEPFPPEAKAAMTLTVEARERGLAIYPGTGSADGLVGDHALITPPMTIRREQVDELLGILDEALAATERALLR